MAKRISLTFLILLAVLYGYLRFVGVEPQDRRPGTRLSGVAAAIPADLSTLALAPEVHLQTHPWYGIPFSVTTVIAHRDGAFTYRHSTKARSLFPAVSTGTPWLPGIHSLSCGLMESSTTSKSTRSVSRMSLTEPLRRWVRSTRSGPSRWPCAKAKPNTRCCV